jgi:hypothetical protein
MEMSQQNPMYNYHIIIGCLRKRKKIYVGKMINQKKKKVAMVGVFLLEKLKIIKGYF